MSSLPDMPRALTDRRDDGAIAKLNGPSCARCGDGSRCIESQRAWQSHQRTKRDATFIEFTAAQQSGVATLHDNVLRLRARSEDRSAEFHSASSPRRLKPAAAESRYAEMGAFDTVDGSSTRHVSATDVDAVEAPTVRRSSICKRSRVLCCGSSLPGCAPTAPPDMAGLRPLSGPTRTI